METVEWTLCSVSRSEWLGHAIQGDKLKEITGDAARFVQCWLGHSEWCTCPVVVAEGKGVHPGLAALFDCALRLHTGIIVGSEWLALWPKSVINADANMIWRMRLTYMGEKP